MNTEQLSAKVKEIKKMGLNDIELFKGKMSMSDLDRGIKATLYEELEKREKALSLYDEAMVEMGDPSEMSDIND